MNLHEIVRTFVRTLKKKRLGSQFLTVYLHDFIINKFIIFSEIKTKVIFTIHIYIHHGAECTPRVSKIGNVQYI